MKKIKYEDLGIYFKKEAEKRFGGWYSDNTNDWLVNMMCAENNASYDEEENLYLCKLEIAKVGKQPLLIEYYLRYIFDEKDNLEDTEYYIY